MGDHGNRISTMTSTYTGRVEERRPFFSIRLPDWFREQNQDLMRTLKLNRHRLTSNFDVHQTLVQLVTGRWQRSVSDRSALNQGVRRGQSLFETVPTNRTCADADIPPQYCTCQIEKQIFDRTKHESKIRKLLIDYLKRAAPCLKLESKMNENDGIKLVDIKSFTISQPVRHGIKYFDSDLYKRTKDVQAAMELSDILVDFSVSNRKLDKTASTETRTRMETVIRHYLKKDLFEMIIDPYLVSGHENLCTNAKIASHLCENCTK